MVKSQPVRTLERVAKPSDRHPLEEEFEVEKITSKKVQDGRVLYLIKWRGFSDSESTWEPIEHMEGSIDLVHQYESDHATKPKVAKKCVTVKSVAPAKRKRLYKEPSQPPSLEVEDWSVVEEPEGKAKAAKKQVRKPKPVPGSFATDVVAAISRVLKAEAKVKFEVSWKDRAGATPSNSIVTLEELEEREPKMLVSFLVKTLGI